VSQVTTTERATRKAIEAVWRIESARLIGGLVRRGLAALARAESLGRPLGPYTLQAAIAAYHARACTGDETSLG
jgi:hypothetical protein